MGSPYDLTGGMSWQDYMNQMQGGAITPTAAAADNAAQNTPTQPVGAFTGTPAPTPGTPSGPVSAMQSGPGIGIGVNTNDTGGFTGINTIAPSGGPPLQGGLGTLGVDPTSMLVRAELGGGTGAGGNFSNSDLGVINQEGAMAGVTPPPPMFNGWSGGQPWSGGAFGALGGQSQYGSPGGWAGAFSSPSFMPSVQGANGSWGSGIPPWASTAMSSQSPPVGGTLPAAGVDGASFVPNAPTTAMQQTAFGNPQTTPQPYGQFSQPAQNSSRFIF